MNHSRGTTPIDDFRPLNSSYRKNSPITPLR